MKNLALKLLAFQKEVGAIPKNEVNPFFKSKYADINTYIEVVKPILSRHGLVILQALNNTNGKASLNTSLIDAETGEEYGASVILPENSDPQKMGAIITYFRRYAIQSMLCLEAEDDDGEKAVGRNPVPTPKSIEEEWGMPDEPVQKPVKVVGAPCPTCKTPLIQGRNGAYCKPCYVKWAEANKK